MEIARNIPIGLEKLLRSRSNKVGKTTVDCFKARNAAAFPAADIVNFIPEPVKLVRYVALDKVFA